MRTIRRVLATFLGVAGATGLVLCAAGVVGCWVVHAEAVRRVDRIFGRTEDALGEVRDALSHVSDQLRRTRRNLDAIRDREADPAERSLVERTLRRAISRKTTEAEIPQLSEARRKLVKAREAALVLEGHVAVLGELPLGERIGVETGLLQDTSDRLEEMIVRSERLATILAKTSPDPTDGASGESSRIGEMLDRIATAIDAGADRASGAGNRVRAWHDRIVRGLHVTGVALTVLLGWIGLGQLSLLTYAGALHPRNRRPEADAPEV